MTALDDHPQLGSDPTAAWSRLGIDPSSARPAWVVLDAIRTFEFSGAVTFAMASHPTGPGPSEVVRVFASRGLVYWAERSSDADVAERLVQVGALTRAESISGTVLLGDVVHIGRLFHLLPGLDVDRVLTAVEYLRDSVIASIADVEVHHVTLVDHCHHESGMVLWELDVDEQPAPAPATTGARRTPPPTDGDVTADVRSAVQIALDEIRAALLDEQARPD